MARLGSFEEYWTATRRGLVVVGRPAIIQELTRILSLPADAPVRLSATRASLVLWGAALELYLQVGAQLLNAAGIT